VRDDLYPIEGTYTGTDVIVEFHGEKDASPGASASLDGILLFHERNMQLQVLYAVGAQKIVRVVQTLSLQSQAASIVSKVNIGGFHIPAIFRFSIIGKVDEQNFGPLLGTLKLLPTSGEDPNPFLVELTTDSPSDVGSLYWGSFTCLQDAQGELNSKFGFIEKGQARLEIEKNQSIISPSWSTLSREELVDGMPGPITAEVGGIPIPAMAESGTLTFTVRSHQISGSVYATGKSAFKQLSIYEAQFTGHEQEIETY
jgi:hypothetical protein